MTAVDFMKNDDETGYGIPGTGNSVLYALFPTES